MLGTRTVAPIPLALPLLGTPERRSSYLQEGNRHLPRSHSVTKCRQFIIPECSYIASKNAFKEKKFKQANYVDAETVKGE